MRKHPAARKPLAAWIRIVEEAAWRNIVEVRSVFPATDAIKKSDLTCFDIGGNNYRLIAIVSYAMQWVVVEEVLTHAEYTKKYRR
jgi:mRNA interferase HigB